MRSPATKPTTAVLLEGLSFAAGARQTLGVTFKNSAMRIFLYFFILVYIFSCCTKKPFNNPNLVINTTLIRSYDSIFGRDTVKHKTYDVKISIINKSDKSVSFWIMSTSWFDDFVINNDYMEFLSGKINHNYAITRHLNPKDSLLYKATIFRNEINWYDNVASTKFGFIFIDSSRCTGPEDLFNILGDKSKHDKIIWSNPLFLNGKK
jgi:hypothetical protein